jgi:hypothetical protein
MAVGGCMSPAILQLFARKRELRLRGYAFLRGEK